MPRQTLPFVLTVVALGIPGLRAAQESTPDFSGTWVINEEESEWGAGGPASDGGGPERRLSTMSISQTGGELKVVFTGPEGPAGNTRETSIKPGTGPQVTSTFNGDTTVEADWEGRKLLVKRLQVIETRRGQTIKTSHRTEWELSSDGHKLTRRTQIKSARGTSYRRIVYDKQ